ncbi:MAG: c-type cytochrome [Bryobacterales bacterium]|nr:c-type cytochrome [Bryobacterales bacterium]
MTFRHGVLLAVLCLAACTRAPQTQEPVRGLRAAAGGTVFVTPSPNFFLEADESLHPAAAPQAEAVWTGLLSVTEGGEHVLRADTEGGEASVTVNGQDASQGVALTSGRHPLTIRFRRSGGPARLQLRWKAATFAEEPVPASAFFHQPEAGDRHALAAEQGRVLAEEMGCVACHAASGLTARSGPRLSHVGERAKAAWLDGWLRNPRAFRAGARMPQILRDEDRPHVVAYLASLGSRQPAESDRRLSVHTGAKGNELYSALGCAACHRNRLVLEGLGSKYDRDGLKALLLEPEAVIPNGRMPGMLLSETEALQLAEYLMDSHKAEFEQAPAQGDPALGRAAVDTARCTACHEIAGIAPPAAARPWTALRAGEGCLAAEPPAGLPRFTFREGEREALTAYIDVTDAHPAPVHKLWRDTRTLGCVSCHRTEWGDPFAITPEAVPPLDGAGAKLRTAWIRQVVLGDSRIHHARAIRMPRFPEASGAAFVEALAKGAGVRPGDGAPPPPTDAARRKQGLDLFSADGERGGLDCLSCHDWGDYRSLGEEGPQLINATARLRYDWFGRWIRDPGRIVSGTSMPQFFADQAGEQREASIASLWAALDLGPKLPVSGLRRRDTGDDPEARPVPADEAVVVRWDMPEATPAAIAVGLPGGVSYCFDAAECRLLYAWRGGFLDMSGTLYRKVDETKLTPTAKPLGPVFYRAPFPIRAGDPERIPDRRFRGYRIVDGVPEFHYELDGRDVFERIDALPRGIRRTFRLPRVDRPMWVEAGPARLSLRTPEIPQGENVEFTLTLEAK